MDYQRTKDKESGYIAIIAIMLLTLLVATGLAYLRWSADESIEYKRQHAATQAYYLAQSAMSQDALPYLEQMISHPPTIERTGTASGINYQLSPGMEGEYIWRAVLYEDTASNYLVANAIKSYTIDITATIKYSSIKTHKGSDEITVTAQVFAKYKENEHLTMFQYYTNWESTHFPGDWIKFMGEDTLHWWVFSNDQIAIMQDPYFYGRVFTTAPDFYQGIGYNPQFVNYDPIFNAPPTTIPLELVDLRANAEIISHEGYNFCLRFIGAGGYEVWEWPAETGFHYNYNNPNNHQIYSSAPPTEGGVFVEGDLHVTGCDPVTGTDLGVAGRISVGCSGNMWLMDNVRYINSNRITGEVDTMSSTPMLGLMSESNVLIQNTWANGRDNGRFRTNMNPDSSDIIINAGIVAWGDCFSFEDQNDIPEVLSTVGPENFWYVSTPNLPLGVSDERGWIRLWGCVAQNKRGYVHRSTHNQTGYKKDYHYDARFKYDYPPYYPEVEFPGTPSGLVAWGQGVAPVETGIQEGD